MYFIFSNDKSYSEEFIIVDLKIYVKKNKYYD